MTELRRINVDSGRPLEPLAHYSRALRVGDMVLQSGTTAIDTQGNVIGEGDVAKQVDAIYVTMQGGVNGTTIPRLVDIANHYRIPTFYQAGSDGVRRGFLLSISRDGGFKPVGRFLAATMTRILNGAKPRDLNQLFEEAPDIAINLKTAETIGLYLYADVLAAADELYRSIEPVK